MCVCMRARVCVWGGGYSLASMLSDASEHYLHVAMNMCVREREKESMPQG